MNKKNWIRIRKKSLRLIERNKTRNDKVVSLDTLYKQVQAGMDEVGIGMEYLDVSSSIRGYSHYTRAEKGGKDNPKRIISVYINSKIVVHDVTSPTIAIELVKSYLLQKKASTDVIEDVTVEINEEPV